jgi:hypothetical protein
MRTINDIPFLLSRMQRDEEPSLIGESPPPSECAENHDIVVEKLFRDSFVASQGRTVIRT